jgi:ABC-type branched-subunit amino acid transport system substrate-binding protein
MVFALVATLGLACGKGEEGKTTIVIGNMTDMTGVAAPALVPMTEALHDMVDEINAGLAPGIDLPEGVRLKVVDYDTAFNPARFVPGYDWLKAKGAEAIISVFNDCSETLKPLAARDKVAVLGMATSVPMIDPPGWVFAFSPPTRWGVKLMLEWIGDQWEAEGKYATGKPTIATVGWSDAWGADNEKGAREYCQAHSDRFDYVGSYMAPVGTVNWTSEVAKTLNVDYVQTAANGASMPATFLRQYSERGGHAIDFDTESMSAYSGYITDYAGWPALNGKLNVQAWGWWNLTQWSEVKYVKDVLFKYHSEGQANEWIHAGMGYLGGGAMQLFALQTVAAAIQVAVEETGSAENFSGQIYYDTATHFMADWAGSQRGFTETRRYAVPDSIVLRWDAAAQDLTLISDGWLPLVIE